MGKESVNQLDKKDIPREYKRRIYRADLKAKELLHVFFKNFKFDKQLIDWTNETAIQFRNIDVIWRAYCKKNNIYHYKEVFKINAFTPRIQLILKIVYSAKTQNNTIHEYILKHHNASDCAAYIIADNKFETL